MLKVLSKPRYTLTLIPTRVPNVNFHLNHTFASTPFESKYKEKLRRRAEESGLSISELKAKAKKDQETQRQKQRRLSEISPREFPHRIDASTPSPSNPLPAKSVRKDSSPVKPLSSILNLPRILSTPHTSDQISALWTAYHVSRSGGTGRGYICASIPLALYDKMASVAAKHSNFVVPLPRLKGPTALDLPGEGNTAYEFYFLQWGFHDVPPAPSAEVDPFSPLQPASSPSNNPPTSTVLFTPLQEYKMRESFATPFLVLTHYTNFASTHGIVLLRGELTPSSATGSTIVNGQETDGRYMLTQEDAQLLAMSLQKYYLWGGNEHEKEGERLLKLFHEKPDEFRWEELLKHSSFIG